MAKETTEQWQSKRLGEVATYINGRAFKPTEWEQNGLPIIRIQNLNNLTAPFNYSNLDFEDKYKVIKGDLLYAWSASLGVYIWNGDSAWLNQHIFKVIPHENCNKKYLYYFLEKVTTELYSKSHGSGMVHVTKGKFEETKIPFPPLKYQKQIADKLDELLSDLENGKQQLELAIQQLKVYRQSLLKWAFESAEKSIAFEEIIESSQNGLSKRAGNNGILYKVLRLADIKNNEISQNTSRSILMNEGEVEKYKINENDLLCIRVNGSKDLVGNLVYVTFKNENDCWAFCDHFIRFKLKPTVLSKYYHYYFSSIKVRKYIHNNMVTSAGQNTVSQGTIKNIEVPLCSKDEQIKVVDELDNKLIICDKIEETINQTVKQNELLKRSILKSAFEGNII